MINVERLSRRDFLKLVTMVGGGVLLGACSPPEPVPTALPRPTARSTIELTPTFPPTRVSTPTRTPAPTSTPEPIPTPTPEPPKLLETIKLDIPGLTVEKYAVKFEEITSMVPESYRKSLEQWIRQPDFTQQEGIKKSIAGKPRYWQYSDPEQQRGLSVLGFDRVSANRPSEYFYFDGNKGKFYGNLLTRLWDRSIISEEDQKILGWPESNWNMIHSVSISDNEKFIYTVANFHSPPENKDYAIILADIPSGMKITMKTTFSAVINEPGSEKPIHEDLTNDGRKLLLCFSRRDPRKRGIYLINLQNWQVQFRLNDPYTGETYINDDGSLLYSGTFIYNTNTNEKTPVNWPRDKDMYQGGQVASRNMKFMTRMVGIFSTYGWVPGQWGTNVYTPEGFFRISAKDRQVITRKIFNDGTLITDNGDIFIFEDGSYKLFKTGDGRSIEVHVTKFPK